MLAGKVTVLAAAGLAAVALSMGAAAAGRTVSGTYVAGSPAGGGIYPHLTRNVTGQRPNFGGVWLKVPAWADVIDVTITDRYSAVVAFDVLFATDPYQPLIASGRFCGSGTAIRVPGPATALFVRVVDLGSLACSPPGLPTTGTVSVTFF